MIIKQKEAIKNLQPSKGVTINSKLRTDVHDEMEQLLLLWIKEKQLAGDSVSGESSKGSGGFKASRGWFDNFKKRSAFIQ